MIRTRKKYLSVILTLMLVGALMLPAALMNPSQAAKKNIISVTKTTTTTNPRPGAELTDVPWTIVNECGGKTGTFYWISHTHSVDGGSTGDNTVVMTITNNPKQQVLPVEWYRDQWVNHYGKFTISFILDGKVVKQYVYNDTTEADCGWKTENITIPAGTHTLVFSVNKTAQGDWRFNNNHFLRVPELWVTTDASVNTFAGLIEAINNAATDGTKNTITLTGDITATSVIAIANNKVIDLDLNGHTLNLDSKYRITVNGGSTLNLLDKSTAGNGKITGGLGNDGGGIAVGTNCAFSMSGGTIQNCTSTDDGGGVYIDSGSTFTMTGGTIKSCSTPTSNNHGGGGVYLQSSTFNMSGGTITGCTSQFGSGIDCAGTFNMSGGSIVENIGAENGGGVFIKANVGAKFIMTGGTITGNVSRDPGKQICNRGGTVTLSEYCTVSNGSNDLDARGGAITVNTKTTLTFVKQTGIGGSESVTALYGTAMPTATMPTKTGYKFVGYFDASSGGTQYYTAAGVSAIKWNKIVPSTTLYAQWEPLKIKFHLENGFGSPKSVDVTYDSAIPSVEAPERSKWIFNGYWDEETDEKIFDASGNPMQTTESKYVEDQYLTACWEKTEHVSGVNAVDEKVGEEEKQAAEEVSNEMQVAISMEGAEQHLETFFEQDDTLSHNLYYKTTVLSATDVDTEDAAKTGKAISMDIKPVEQAYEHGVKRGDENELEIPEGTKMQMRIVLPNMLDDADRIYLKHVKEDGTTYYEDLQVKWGAISFVNEHGFSEFDICTEKYGNEPEFSGHSLLLGGEIGVNFLMTIPEAYKDGSMKFIVDGRETTANGVYDEKSNSYKFTCYLNAIQMAEEITAVYSCDGYSQIQKYSIAKYLEEAKEEGTTNMRNLAYKMHSYGYYAQKYLNELGKINLGNGTDKYSEMTIPAVATNTGVNLSSYEVSISDNGNENITEVKKTLVLDSKVGLNLYLTLSDDATYNAGSKPVVTVDGETLDASKISFETSGDTTMIVKMDSISASKLGHAYTVVVDGNYTIKVSAMSYADALMRVDTHTFSTELGAAIYEYYKSVMEYAGLELE